MAIAPTAPKGLEALLPRTPANDRTSVAGDAIELQISRTRTGQLAYRINQTNIARDEIRGRLQAIFATRRTKAVSIGDDKDGDDKDGDDTDRGDKDLDFSPIARSIDVASSAGMDHVGLITPRVIAAGGKANR